MFGSSRGCEPDLLLQWEGLCTLSTHLASHPPERSEERLTVNTEAKPSLGTSAFSPFMVASLPAVFIGAVHFLWPSFSG